MKLSIITINYNNAAGLDRTIQSVINQPYSDFEYIVIDGGSDDGSLEVIKKHVNNITTWLSEPDTGIYNAMNKGIHLAKGEYLLFINSGDQLIKNSYLWKHIDKLENKDLIYFDLIVVNNDRSSFTKNYPSQVNLEYFFSKAIPHPGSLIKSNLFIRYGNYDENMKICSDWAFFVKIICKHKSSYKHISQPISIFYMDGISSDSENLRTILNEKKLFFKKHFPFFWFKKYIFPKIRAKLVNHLSLIFK